MVSVAKCLIKVVLYILSVFLVVYGEKVISIQKKHKSSREKTFKGNTQKLPISQDSEFPHLPSINI